MRLSIFASMAVGAALLIAACGGGGSSNSASSTPAKSPSGSALVNSADTASLGNIIVGPNGRTLYIFRKDTGPNSTCSGACAAEWPPLTTASGKVTTSGGVSSSALKAVRRSDGKMQVTFNGRPLYYFAGDSAAGQANGQGLDTFGALWYALSPSGKEITTGGGPHGGY
jgi:predicted lipoprotein with Yx(FWY)xxD motif